jgi:hypothetical protein
VLVVVDRNSAIIGDAFEKKSSIYSTHQDMCRFSGRKSDGYQKTLASIQEFIIPTALSGSGAQDSDESIATIHATALYTQPDEATQGGGFSVATQKQDSGQVSSNQTRETSNPHKPFHACEEQSVSPLEKSNIPPRKLRARLWEKNGDHVLSVFFEDRCLNIQFHRTVRVPDDGRTYNLPANLGTFPLFNIADFTDTLSQDVVEKGGFFLPMYRKLRALLTMTPQYIQCANYYSHLEREAMWISFHEEGEWQRQTRKAPFAIRIYAGGVNAISGEPMRPNMATFLKSMNGVPKKQDYIVFPKQHWIDGAAVSPGVVRQFVAMPYGSGSSIEKQITGLETVGGIQIEIIPASAGMRILIITCREFYVYMRPDDTVDLLLKTIASREGIPTYEYKLYFSGRQLEGGKNYHF